MNNTSKTYVGIGVMSGTSVDGLDLCACRFFKTENIWSYELIDCKIVDYSSGWVNKLTSADELSGLDLMLLHNEFGNFIGSQVKVFASALNEKVDFVSSHGHTVFHQIEKKLTTQIGNGANIRAISGVKTITDFRSIDVALGGQGAPLVPIGDRILFSDFGACLNIGGIANISFEKNGKTTAFDIAGANMVLNFISLKLGCSYDKGGELGKKGKLIPELLEELNALEFYKLLAPKSIGKEWVLEKVFPLLDKRIEPIFDVLNTYYHHLAEQISKVIKDSNVDGATLISGGGAKNNYLLSLIESLNVETVVPDERIIDFKEAIIFAFLGMLNLQEEPNCLSSVTGSTRDNIGGCIFP